MADSGPVCKDVGIITGLFITLIISNPQLNIIEHICCVFNLLFYLFLQDMITTNLITGCLISAFYLISVSAFLLYPGQNSLDDIRMILLNYN